MIFATKIRAIDPSDGELKTWGGQPIEAISWNEAESLCEPYEEVDGVLWSEIDFETGKRTNSTMLN